MWITSSILLFFVLFPVKCNSIVAAASTATINEGTPTNAANGAAPTTNSAGVTPAAPQQTAATSVAPTSTTDSSSGSIPATAALDVNSFASARE